MKSRSSNPFTRLYEPPEPAAGEAGGNGNGRASSTAPEAENCTDLGNARRFARMHGAQVRYCHPWNSWLIWDGRRWKRDETGGAVRLAKRTCRAIWDEVKSCSDSAERNELISWAKRSESSERIHAMLKLAQSEEGIPVLPDHLDADPFAFNCPNGTIDLRTLTLREHAQRDLITKLSPVPYEPDAECPRWIAFMNEIMLENQGVIDFLQRYSGYSLTGDISDQSFLVLHGAGANGKSMLLNTLSHVYGDYSTASDFSTFCVRPGDGPRDDIAELRGIRMVNAVESTEGRRFSEALLKRMTGGDKLRGRKLYQEAFTFIATFKLWFACNHRPLIKGTDDGIWRRVRLVPFQFTVERKDPNLCAVLREEAAGILAWAVRGCADWQRDGMNPPKEVTTATEEYKSESDQLGEFIDACCAKSDDAQAKAADLYKSYEIWCKLNGEEPMTSTMFGRRLADRGFSKKKEQTVTWHGLGLVKTESHVDS